MKIMKYARQNKSGRFLIKTRKIWHIFWHKEDKQIDDYDLAVILAKFLAGNAYNGRYVKIYDMETGDLVFDNIKKTDKISAWWKFHSYVQEQGE